MALTLSWRGGADAIEVSGLTPDRLATLGERDMELISLRHGADLSIGQIAEVVGMTPGAVRVALHRAHARLRAELERAEAAPHPRTAVGFEAAP
jgi:DNA-directed RNA polymerase specialized sigma24 family protein